MTTSSFVLKRLTDDWKLLLAIFAGVSIAATLLAGAPIYVATLERQGINTAIDRADQSFLNIFTAASHITLSRAEIDRTEQALGDAIADNIPTIYRGRERYLKTSTFLVGTQDNPFPERLRTGDETLVSRGYFQYMSNPGRPRHLHPRTHGLGQRHLGGRHSQGGGRGGGGFHQRV